MKIQWLATGFVLAWAAGSSAAQTAAQRDELEASTTALAGLMLDNRAQAHPQLRKLSFGPLCGAGHQDAAVLFSIEGFYGSNSHSQYVAVYEDLAPSERESAKLGAAPGRSPVRHYRLLALRKVGGSGERAVDHVELRADQVQLIGKRNTDNDSPNQPTQPFTEVLSLNANEQRLALAR